MTDNTKARSRKANKRAKVAQNAQRTRNHNRYRRNQRSKHDNQRRLTVGGLFVRLIKDYGFVRTSSRTQHTVFAKEAEDGQTHTITMDYIPGKAALLVVYDGSDEILNRVLYYREQPIPEATRRALFAPKRPARRPKPGKNIPQWKRELAQFNGGAA